MNIENYIIEQYKHVKASRFLGIFGHPIKHTLSPVIHDNLSSYFDLDQRYVPFDIEEETSLVECVNAAFKQNILGLNITVPYKQKVMEALCEIDSDAEAIGAVNTLVRIEQGYKGYNTDMPGLFRSISSEGIDLKDKNIIMLGAGGAARAVAYMCMKYDTNKVYIVNRTFEKAKMIADDMNPMAEKNNKKTRMIAVSAEDYKKIPRDKYIMIQCTSIGLKKEDGLPLVLDECFYDMCIAGIDLIYNPAVTPFIRLLTSKGIKVMNGLKMLLYQGIMAYEKWNQVVVTEEMCECIYRKLKIALYGNVQEENANNIILVGYMGAGKTTVGKEYAILNGYDFIDTDEYIETKMGMKIADIFEKYNEAYFRKLETEVLEELLSRTKKSVISTGGGLPIRNENRALLRKLGTSFYLRATAETTYERIKGCTNRPLLMCDNPKQKIHEMLLERKEGYLLAADIIIDTDKKAMEEIIDIIKKADIK